ncbi:hypothetical protein PPYR_01150 [Photinus pyralis]|uniref:Antistasin-like domain-containing protein n=1 Tax=Photinus pyralis TaxID=7054 RepID=A0A5N4B490_PHOPY|nr:ghilanten-like [Photinus pyralis]KAB0804180.1 hypothetical protein PPYR_01150 [Photinus pyralis]
MKAITCLQFLILTVALFQSQAQNCPDVICAIACLNGHDVDQFGCPICKCFDPCEGLICPVGQVCQSRAQTCTEDCCSRPSICVPFSVSNLNASSPICPKRKCENLCPYGYAKDSDGCQTCDCIDHCKEMNCSSERVCQTEELCPTGDCGKTIKCVTICADLPCHANTQCPQGFQMDERNCPTCLCKEDCEFPPCGPLPYCKTL